MNCDLVPNRVLQLGSGRKYRAGAVNVDITSDTSPDIVHDLNVTPWPFEADSFDEVHAYDVVEHLVDTVSVLEEMYRVSRSGALLHLTVPHYSSCGAFVDPTHRRFFAYRTFDYFLESHELNFYSRCRISYDCRQLVFEPTLVNKIVHRLAGRYPDAYERRWAGIFPAWFLYVRLRVEK